MFDDLKSESFNFLHETSLINTLESDNTEHIIENNKVILKVSKSDSNIQHFENPIKDSVDNVINSFNKLWIIVYTIIAIVAVIIILWILIIIIYKIKKFKSSVESNKNNKTKVEITEAENNNKQPVKGIKSNDNYFNIENAFWKNK
jgi:Na+-transporting methylmalonyl-CoA/oxaloacetate decarboxylase gamma subunit